MTRTLEATNVLLTGAGGAIGRAIAVAFRKRWPNARLALVDISESGLRETQAAVGGDVVCHVHDLSDIESLEALVRHVERDGPVDVLVNCAGVFTLRTIAGSGWMTGSRQLQVNLIAPMRLMDLCLPAMQQAGRGLVVNIASIGAIGPIRGGAYYCGAKSGIAMASEIARLEAAESDVHVLTVYPGPVHSPLEAGATAEAPSFMAKHLPTGDADVLAAKIVAAVDHQQARLFYPAVYEVMNRFPVLMRKFSMWASPAPLQ